MQYESSSLARLDAFEPINRRVPSLTETFFLLREKRNYATKREEFAEILSK